ncbi:unnamed protein product, partial [Cyprideis torosa]
MGLSQLSLVSPVDFPSEEANRLAAGAQDILQSATVVEHLESLVQDSRLVVACTARPRGFDLPELTPDKAAEVVLHHARSGPVAVLYGPERFGLSNEHLRLARYRVTIPTSPDYPSLNLAAAVQLMSYEIYKAAAGGCSGVEGHERSLPSTRDMELFYEHLHGVLKESGFINQKHPGKIMEKLRRLFARAEPDDTELNILRG